MRFLDIVRASANETRALLRKGHAIRYLPDEQFVALDNLAIRGLQAMSRVQQYLRSPAAKRNAELNRHRRQKAQPPPKPTFPDNSNVSNVSNGPNDPNDPNDSSG